MTDNEKISLEEIKKIPAELLQSLINKAKRKLKNDETMQNIFKEYGVDVNIIDFIPTAFSDLEVSAKTDHGIVYLNYKLLCDGDFNKDYSYLIHEYTHWAQQCLRDKPTQSADDGEYLDNPHEKEGFQNQIEYIANEFGEDEAEKYVDDLLNHHEVNDKKEKTERKDELMSKV